MEDNVKSNRLVSTLFHSLSLTLYPLIIITTDKLHADYITVTVTSCSL